MNNPLDKYSLQELRAIMRGKLEPSDEWLMQVAAHAIQCQIEGIQDENTNRLLGVSLCGENNRHKNSMETLRMVSRHSAHESEEQDSDEAVSERLQSCFKEAIEAIA